MKKNWLDFGDLDPIFNVTGGGKWHPISEINGWILIELVHLYCCDMGKNWLDFCDVDPIFKVE